MIRVLYVDDEPELLDIGKLYLEQCLGFSVDTVTSANDALLRITQGSYDAIVSDYMMPGMDGIALLKHIRQINGSIPFILLTGRGREEVVIEALNSGADFYLQKGGSPRAQFAELVHKIRQGVQRDRLQREIERFEEQRRHFMDSLPIGLFRSTTGPEARFTFANPRLATIYGCRSVEDLLKYRFTDLHADPDEWKKVCDLLKSQGKVTGADIRLKNTNNEIVYARISAIGIRNIKDEVEYIEGAIEDLSGNIRAQAVLESEKPFRIIADSAYDWVYWMGPDGEIRYSSPSCERITGYPAGEFERDPSLLVSLIHPDDREVVSVHFMDKEKSGGLASLEFRIVSREGSVHWIHHVCLPVFDAEGTFLGRCASNREITEQKRAEDAIRQVNKKLNILSSITRHDILNKITVLRGYLEIARNDPSSPMLPEYLKRIEEAVVVIHDQIAFTKEYQNLGIAQPAWQDVSFAFRKAASCFDLSNKTVAIETKGTEIYADPLLDRVFYNLIDNTLKHGMTATHIAVHAGRSDAGFDIIYEDNGTGILENDKKKVFLRGIGRNSGLGLYLAREILSITGIDIRETGEPGTGARFEIRIPKGGYRCVSPSRGNTI